MAMTFPVRVHGMETGAITVFSHSITIDTAQMDRAAHIAAQSEVRYNEDPFGYFRITLDGDAILVEHRSGDVTLGTYRHAKASHIQYEIYRDCAVSDISHAIYLRQLARAEACLEDGREFIQNSATVRWWRSETVG
jgi:thymidylate synthase